MRVPALVLLALLWVGVAPATTAQAEPTVIVLSFDGVRYDYLDRGGLPALERMAREGARAEALVPVFPASTFPNHVAMATGARTDRHGIVANHFFDPELGEFDYSNDARFIDAEPLWVAAERQGVRAAAFYWVGSETDWNGIGASYRKTPFSGKVPESKKVDQILAWIDLPPAERPHLVMSWWHGADSMGHRHGPDHEDTLAQLRGQDAELGRLLSGLDARDAWGDTTLFVVSDHGMASIDRATDLRPVLADAGIKARVVQGGAYALVYLEDPSQAAVAATRLDAIPGVQAWPAGDLPLHLRFRHPTRVGHVVALTDPPNMLTRSSSTLNRWRRASSLWGGVVGTHGYDPAAHPEMGALLLALGRGVTAGARLPRVQAIDLAPTVAHLLGIAPPRHSEGTPIAGIGGSGPAE